MELRVLKYFLAVAQEQSITKASEILYITQPTLSRQIAELEEELGTALFIRSNRNVMLTEAGMLFRRRALEMVELEDKIKNEFLYFEENLSGTISLGMAETFSSNVVAQVIKLFQKKYPDVKFELYTAMADQVLERIDRGSIDIGFLLEPINVDKYDFIRLPIKEKLGIITNCDDPILLKPQIEPEDLLDYPVLVPMRRELKQNTRNVIGPIYDKFNILGSFNVVNNALLLAENKTARVIAVEGAFQYNHNSLLAFRPFKNIDPLGCVAAFKKYQPSNRCVSRFLEEITMLFEHNSK